MLKDELTLSQPEIYKICDQLCSSGWQNTGRFELLFQSKANRDAVYREAKSRGAILRRSSTGHQLLDPRYTVEGSDIPDRGLMNDYRHSFANLYELRRIG